MFFKVFRPRKKKGGSLLQGLEYQRLWIPAAGFISPVNSLLSRGERQGGNLTPRFIPPGDCPDGEVPAMIPYGSSGPTFIPGS